jgi:hypothetical protein
MKHLKTFESFGMGMSREEMCQYLCNCGYDRAELEECPMEELHALCQMCQAEEGMTMSEKKGEKWIADAIKDKGSLRKKMGKKEGEKISDSEINDELAKLHKKDKDPNKKGDQLSPSDAKKKKELVLAKTLKKMK